MNSILKEMHVYLQFLFAQRQSGVTRDTVFVQVFMYKYCKSICVYMHVICTIVS